MLHRIQVRLALLLLVFIATSAPGGAQERVKIAYSSADASNAVWFTALDGGIYRKYGLDVELIFIQSSTMSVSTRGLGRYSSGEQLGRRGGERGRRRRQFGDDRLLHQHAAL